MKIKQSLMAGERERERERERESCNLEEEKRCRV